MKIILLGSGGYRPNDRRQTASILLAEAGMVLDAGTGFYRVLDHLATDRLHVLLSHAHLDHVMGLTFLFDLLAARPNLVVTVHGEPEKLATIERHLWYPGLFPARPPCHLVPLSTDSLDRLPIKTMYFPLQHPGGSVGFRLTSGTRSLAYVTDTTADANADYVRHIRGVDLLIHECYFGDEQRDLAHKTGHSCTSAVAAVAAAAGVQRLVLVHLNPLADSDDGIEVERARSIFPNTIIGTDLMTLTW